MNGRRDVKPIVMKYGLSINIRCVGPGRWCYDLDAGRDEQWSGNYATADLALRAAVSLATDLGGKQMDGFFEEKSE